MAVALLSGANDADARKRFGGSSSGIVDTTYGYAIINGVFVSFVCASTTSTTCTATSPSWLAGRTVVRTSTGWALR